MTTEEFLKKTDRLNITKEVSDPTDQWKMFNDAGTEVEVSEFIYSLVRMIKPTAVLETGTHIGISSSYIAQALKENKKGDLITCEVNETLVRNAQKLWEDLGLEDLITVVRIRPSNLNNAINSYSDPQPELNNLLADKTFDLVLLDSEPQIRFNEFLKYFDKVNPGGFILIHDLHPHLGYTPVVNTDHPNHPSWPWGDFREKLGSFIKEHKVQTVSFPTPRGFTLFQKDKESFTFNRFLNNEL
jgi:predicted O-methyltransferase YrrM